MKFKDIIIIIFLTVTLVYAACRRNNILRTGFDKGRKEAGLHSGFEWSDSIRCNTLDILVDPAKGLIIKNISGEIITGKNDLKAEAIDIKDHQIYQGDTISLLYCKLTDSDSIPCYRLTEDGQLLRVKI